MIDRRTLMAGLAAGTYSLFAERGAGARPGVDAGAMFTPEAFGARGDGRTNDSAAFAALAAHVNSLGGGTIVLRPVTYIVGSQALARPGGPLAYEPTPLLHFENCSRPLIIRGNGAKLQCAPGLRFGAFNPRTGRPTRNPMPFYGDGERATPYKAMILVRGSRADVEISDFELDGNVRQLVIGGPWGDVGHQIAAFGIALYDNAGTEVVRNVYTHHHALDGLLIDGLNANRRTRSRIEGVRSEYNARQGCSIVGGRGYDFVDCIFSHTGKAGLVSPPGGGVDIEAEEKEVRDLTFTGCRFADNAGPGLVADVGDNEGATFNGCTFVGTTSWSAWPRMPRFQFTRCTFVGGVVNPFDDAARPERATKFTQCRFFDDPSLSPTGEVHGNHLVEASTSPAVAFTGCIFRATHRLTLPWTTGVTYENCTMSQRSSREAYPRGRFLGENSIVGPVDLHGSVVVGKLTLNGVQVPPGRL